MRNRRYIYVQDMEGRPLMPTSPARARQLLRSGGAVLADRSLFVIRLTGPSASCRQETVMGVDFGSRHIGVSVTTDRRELHSSEVLLRDDISRRLVKRRELRRGRRFRGTRYRAARFSNRTAAGGGSPGSRPSGFLRGGPERCSAGTTACGSTAPVRSSRARRTATSSSGTSGGWWLPE